MAYTFPLAVADFWDLLPIQSVTMAPVEQVELSETGGGEFLAHDLGPQLWQGQVSLGKMTPMEAALIVPMVNLLRAAGRHFYAWDRRRYPGPAADPQGAVLGVATPTVLSVNANGREIALQGLPVGYVLGRGDMLALQAPYGRVLLQVLTINVVANGSGQTAQFEVVPPFEAGITVGTAVTLVRASGKFMIRPGSIQEGISFHGHVEGMAFEFQQTLG